MNKELNSRILFLDILRGIAALSVVLFHYSRDLLANFFITPITYGYMGVHLFFIISGFVIFMTLEKTRTSKQFIVSRFSRLYPGYWVNVLLTFFLILFLDEKPDHRSLEDLSINMTMLQHWFLIPPIDGVYWTLTIELSFYFLMLILFTTNQLNKIYLWGLIFTFSMFAVKYLNGRYDLPLYYILPLWHWGNLFFAGIVFYRIYAYGEKVKEFILLIITILAQFILNNNIYENILVVFLFLSFYGLMKFKYDWSKLKYLIILGNISYPLYLIHEVNGKLLFNQMHFITSPFIKVCLIFSLMVIMSFLITYLIERPFQQMIRKKVHKAEIRLQ